MNKSKPLAVFIACIALVTMVFICLVWPVWRDANHPENSIWLARMAWLVTVACLLVFLMAVSVAVTQRPLGFLINERNLMSLTRFQTVLWTVIILSAFFVVALDRIISKKELPLEIAVDKRLWALLGISLTSLVGTSLINSTKTNKTPDEQEAQKTAKALAATGNAPARGNPRGAVVVEGSANAKKTAGATLAAQTASVKNDRAANKQGTLYANPSMNDASFSDM